MARRHRPAEGRELQAFQFTLDPDQAQWAVIRRQWGGRRFTHNWAVGTIKVALDAYQATGEDSQPPSLYGLRKLWNQEKGAACVDSETGAVWWPEVSKEAFADGIRGAVDGYWRWQQSRAGKLAGRRVGFPRFKRKGRDEDRCTFTTGAIRVEPDRRHLTLPHVGTVRVHENARRLERLIGLGRAKILAATLKRVSDRAVVAFRVEAARPQRGHPTPAPPVGVDVGVRRLATVATPEGVVERVPNPAPLAKNISKLRRICRAISRCKPGSRREKERQWRRSKLQARIPALRRDAINKLTTRLAKTHGRIVVEGLDATGMLRQKGLPGARARRRGLSDAALAEPRRQLRYKAPWYGSKLVEADRFYPSSKTCCECEHVQEIGWAEYWTCEACGARHQRDDCAAVNLARYCSPVGSVGAPVKRGADRKTQPRWAGGIDTRKRQGNPVRGAA